MKTSKLSASAVLGLGMLLGAGMAAAQVPDSASDCVACHNENGVSDDPAVPIIAGNAAFFIENQLAMFAQEARPCEADYFASKDDVSAESHCTIVADLSEDDYADIAAYFEELPFVPADQEFDADLASQGESIHTKSCDRCHTEAGSLAFDEAGILAGQWKEYLTEQIGYYKTGKRWQPEKMAPEIEELSDADVEALVNFYAREGSRFE
ncbi:MAG: c-type cytochrome [Wenzhouxiangellaceae bacterium]|nr:c-type cytochrome [Wenzhouxiangellaceae bacterium]